MEYGQVCKYLDNCLIFGIKPGLARIKKILELLDNPQKKVEFIHVVGTNGKTSTTSIAARILKYHGIKTAYHISPHINSYTERIWVSGKGRKMGCNQYCRFKSSRAYQRKSGAHRVTWRHDRKNSFRESGSHKEKCAGCNDMLR